MLLVQNVRGKTFNCAIFSNDSSFIRWENGESLHLHPDFSPHPFGHFVIFLGKSEGARKPMSGTFENVIGSDSLPKCGNIFPEF